MQKVKVITDTVAGIPRVLAEQYHIKVVPAANIVFDGRTYIDGVDINPAEAYSLLRVNPDKFTTSAINPGYILDTYRELSKKTRHILFISLASVLSAVFKSATLAANTFREESPETQIRIFDSRACAGAQGLVVLAAARAAAQGMDLDQVVNIAEQTRQKTGGFMLLDTLRYIYRTGRMSKTASRIATMLHIKPINRITEKGMIELVDKVRNREVGVKRVLELVKKEAGTDALHFMVMHAAAPTWAEELCQRLQQEFKCLSTVVSEYSPVMGYSVGTGTLFVGFHPELNLFKG